MPVEMKLLAQSSNYTKTKEVTSSNKGPGTDNTKIARFYEGKNVLVTGGSGFLGKVLLWKLYESCPGINKIYVLLRAKSDISADKRLVQMLKAAPFNLKHEYTDLLNKMVAIESDITNEGLGLSQTDRSLLIEQVNIVFHSAASVSFDAPLRDNLRDNVVGTQEIVKLCNEITHLDALVHVSTAYSNCHLKYVPEALVPMQLDDETVLKMSVAARESQHLEATPAGKLLEGRPNTYTYTKALAEHCVAKNEGKYPISIVRPSIVIASDQEPCPGWVDNVNGLSGLTCLGSIGLLRTIDWDYYAKSDVVPVDYVANCMICTAYDVHVRSPKKIEFYNMTSGSINPVTWGGLFDKLRRNATLKPPSKIVRPIIQPPRHRSANLITFTLTKLFSELLFAYMVDLILVLIGYKKIVLKITKKMHHGYKILKPFTTNEWDFEVDNVLNLSDSLDATDKRTFNFDLRQANWDEIIASMWTGLRKFVLKDEPTEESYRSCLTRQTVVEVVHYTGLALMMALFAAMIAYTCASLLVAWAFLAFICVVLNAWPSLLVLKSWPIQRLFSSQH